MKSSRLLRLVSSFALLVLGSSCGGDEAKSASVRVSALATESTTLDGPSGSTLVIPAGASDTDVTIVLSVPSTRRQGPASTVVVADGFRLTPEGKTFMAALELTIPISPSSLPAGKTIDDVVVVRAPQGTGTDSFVPLPTRREGNAVVASTEHFSDFLAIVVDDGAQPFGTCGDDVCASDETCGGCPYDCGVCLPNGGDTTPPTVSALTSPSQTTDVRGDAAITVHFDEAILANSVAAGTFSLTGAGGTPVDGVFTVVGGDVTLTPTVPLAGTTTYTLKIDGVRDGAGNVMTAAFTTTFTTATRADIETTTPSGSATDVLPSTLVSVTFKSPIAPTTLTTQAADGPCTGSIQLSSDAFVSCLGATSSIGTGDTSVLLIPAATFVGGASISVRFTSVARDALGFALNALGQFGFTIEQDTTSPTFVSSTPMGGAGGVELDTMIELIFSEPIAPASISAASVSFGTDGSPVPSTRTAIGNTITIVPTVPLAPSTHYSVAVAGVTDRSGNGTGDLASFSFDTLARPRIVSGRFPYGADGVHPRADLDFTFDRAVNAATLTMQANDTPVAGCVGSIRVTDGTTCFGGALQILSATDIVVRATTSLPLDTTIAIRVESTATDSKGIAFAGVTEWSFRVSPVNAFAYSITASAGTDGAFSDGVSATPTARADELCDPAGNGSRKAFLITPVRYPCISAWCGLDSTPETSASVDWVLATSTTYLNGLGFVLFTTSPDAPIVPYMTALTHQLSGVGGNFWWGGQNSYLPSTTNCNDFTSVDSMEFATVGWDGSTDDGWIAGGQIACSGGLPVLCVEQPPAIPHPIH